MRCRNCGTEVNGTPIPVPPEPPVGTWVKDHRGSLSVRVIDGDGHDGWAPAPHGFYACGKWEAMWEAHGPLVECPPWGIE